MEMSANSRAIDKIYKRRDRYEIPEWQRQEVWTRSKKQNLIDSILRDWKLPKFYFLKTNEDEYDVVDGQQRLVAIWEFFDNELPLSPASAAEFGGTYYKDLSVSTQDDFDDYEIEFDVIENASEKDVKEFFQRLQEGLPLSSSEKLNSMHSKLRDFAAKLAKDAFFKKKISAPDTRYGHFDIVAKAAAIEIDGLDVGTRYDDVRAVFESQAQFSSSSNVAKRLRSTLRFLDKAFRKRSLNLRNRTIVQSLITLTARLVSTGKASGREKQLANFFDYFMDELSRQVELGSEATDQDYLAFQRTVNANVRSGPKARQQLLLRKLLSYDPTFAEVFDAATIVESGLTLQIRQDAAAIATLVGSLNDRYSAEHGHDLFKPTNKTVLSQIALGKVAADFEGYKSLVDNLYFLFHEGTGTRLDGKKPDSFKDVNDLRTALQHDVDHGSAGKVRSKKKKLGETFKKYSGELSPQTLAPERFQVVQANLLGALRNDLENLKW